MNPTTSTMRAMIAALAVPDFNELSVLSRWMRSANGEPEDCPGLDDAARANLQRIRADGSVEAELRRCELLGVEVLDWNDPRYPVALLDLAAPPPVLYLRGEGPWPPGEPITVVGARRSTSLGRDFARQIGCEIAGRGASVVSGLAIGIDQAALDGAAQAKGAGYGVLACGVDRVYPSCADHVAREICARGRLVSEMPIGTDPLRHYFPRRNRLLAALSTAVIVVEADLQSGSLITAHHALDLGRDVFAVPGSIDVPSSRGTNRLIRDGAHPLLERSDLDCILPRRAGNEDEILAQFHVARSAEDVAEATGRPLDEVLLRIVDLEVEGHLARLGAGLFRAAHNHSARR